MSGSEGHLLGGEIFYRAWQSPLPCARLVIAHGYAEHSGRYSHVAEQLVAAGISVWAPDHRGHGRSSGERGDVGSLEKSVSDLDLVVDLVAASGPDRPTFLLGHSLGGAIAIAYALAHQDRLAGLSLSAPAINIPSEMLALVELEEIPPLSLADGISSSPAVVEAYKSDPLVYLGPPPRNLLIVMSSIGGIVARLGELTLPIQVMQGSADALIPPQALRDVVGGVSSEDLVARLWPGLYHEIFNEPVGATVIDALISWILDRTA